MTAFQINSKYYDPALEQLGDGLSPATAYGMAGGKWRTNIYRLFSDLLAQIASLVVGTVNASNIFGHEMPTSAISLTLTNASKRSQAITMSAPGQAVRLPDATTIAKGERWRLRNAGATHAWALQDNAGGPLVASVAIAEEIVVQCEANGSPAGTWRILETSLGRKLGAAASSQVARSALGMDAFRARNRILNGCMRLDQRNEGAVVVVNSASNKYGIDRWLVKGEAADGVFQVQRLSASPPPGFTHYYRAAVTTADASIALNQSYLTGQYLEGQDIADLLFGMASAKAITLSFWARASLTGTFDGVIRNGDGSRVYPFSYTINIANTWEQKTITLPVDLTGTWVTGNTTGMQVMFCLGTNAGNRAAAGVWTAASGIVGASGAINLMATLSAVLDWAGVQLEEGSVATPFEMLSFAELLARCQRYHLKSFPIGTVPAQAVAGSGIVSGISDTAGHIAAHWSFPATMRADPTTVTLYTIAGAGAVNGQWFNIDTGGASTAASASLGMHGGAIYGTGVANVRWAIRAVADAELY
jgi:hypothetical protein